MDLSHKFATNKRQDKKKKTMFRWSELIEINWFSNAERIILNIAANSDVLVSVKEQMS